MARKLIDLLKLITGEGSKVTGNGSIITNDYSANNSVIAPSVGQMLNVTEDGGGDEDEDRVEEDEDGHEAIQRANATSAAAGQDAVLDLNEGNRGPSLNATVPSRSSAHQVRVDGGGDNRDKGQGDDDDEGDDSDEEDVDLANRPRRLTTVGKEPSGNDGDDDGGRRSADYDFMTVVADVEHKFE